MPRFIHLKVEVLLFTHRVLSYPLLPVAYICACLFEALYSQLLASSLQLILSMKADWCQASHLISFHVIFISLSLLFPYVELKLILLMVIKTFIALKLWITPGRTKILTSWVFLLLMSIKHLIYLNFPWFHLLYFCSFLILYKFWSIYTWVFNLRCFYCFAIVAWRSMSHGVLCVVRVGVWCLIVRWVNSQSSLFLMPHLSILTIVITYLTID